MFSLALLDEGASPDGPGGGFPIPISSAAKEGHIEFCRLLLDRGAEINGADEKNGATALYRASRFGKVDVVELLLGRGAHVDKADVQGWTSLHISAQEKHVEIMKILIDHNASINFVSTRGATPLYIAVLAGKVSSVELLLDHGADVNIFEEGGGSPLLCAAQAGFGRIANMLVKRGAIIDVVDEIGTTPLVGAASSDSGNMEIFELLLGAGANVNHVNKHGVTALYMCLQNKHHFKIVELLLKNGAKVDLASSFDGTTSLLIALQVKANAQLLEILLDAGAAVNKASSNGVTPLYMATGNGDVEVLKLLLRRGANIHKSRWDGVSPIIMAASKGHIAALKVLLEHGGVASKADKHGKSARQWAQESGHIQVIAQLNTLDSFQNAVIEGSVGSIKACIMGGGFPVPLIQWLPILQASPRAALASWVSGMLSDMHGCYVALFSGTGKGGEGRAPTIREVTQAPGPVRQSIVSFLVPSSKKTRLSLREVFASGVADPIKLLGPRSPPLELGDICVVHGLTAAGFNGKFCEVLGALTSDGRYPVRIFKSNSGEYKAAKLKVTNLVLFELPASSPAP